MNESPPLLEGAIYISPLGRRCQWDVSDARGNRAPWLTFLYCDGRSKLGVTGFSLSRANLHILRLERRR